MYLTKKQREMFNFIVSYINEKGFSPTLEEIAEGLGLSSIATVHKHLKNLEEKDVIRRKWNHGRAIEITAKIEYSQSRDLPLLGVVAAGRPIEAIEDNATIAVPEDFLRGKDTFVLKVKGDSMIDDHISDGDFVVVERRNTANNGDTAVVMVRNEEATVKRFYHEGDRIRLQPANETMQPMYFKPEEIEVKGIVIALMRKYF